MAQKSSDLVRVGNVILVGVVHYRIEFAVLVRKVISQESPDCVCVELPHALSAHVSEAIRGLPYHSVIIHQAASNQTSVLIVEGSDGIVEAARSAIEEDIPLWMVEPIPDSPPAFFEAAADPYLVDLLGQQQFLETALAMSMSHADEAELRRESYMAARIQEAAKRHAKVLFVGGLAHIPRIAELLRTPQALPLMNIQVLAATTAPLHPDSLKKGFTEIPRLTEAYERWRKTPTSEGLVNRHELILSLMKSACDYYERQTRQEVPDAARLTWARFLRKWLRYKGLLLPDLYHLAASARAAMDEDFAYHVHEYLCEYAWTNDPLNPASVTLNEDNLMFHGHKIVLHKKLRTLFGRRQKYHIKAVGSSKWKEHLKRKWEEANPDEVDICSYPPEDVAIERWGEALMKHAHHILQASRSGSEPFVSEMHEGPDVRETLRRFYEDRIYVKVDEPGGYEFGSVVVIFDEDERAERYPFQMTWLGEHSQESDMAFYSTAPGVEVVGPGISRLEHGGFVMSYPPLRMYDVWTDPAFGFVDKRHERLLVAGIAYSEKPGIVYVAKKPPAKQWKRLAASMGKRVVYVPLGSLNPSQVRRMRTFHLLQNKGLRNRVHEYLKRS
ncbi:MAG: hypothetical protein ACPL7J_01590 [Desulfomonilaceae bacterium]